MEMTLSDGVGVLGMVLIVGTYFLLQAGRIESRSLVYSAANGVGAAGILFSLVHDFNFGAFAVESFWLLISVWGVARALRPGRRSSGPAQRLNDRSSAD